MITPMEFALSISLAFSSGLSCPPTKIENRTDSWTKFDHDTLMRAKKKCAREDKEVPCLVFFRKKSKDVYHAVCGKETK